MFRYSDPADALAVGFNDCVDVDPHAASKAVAAITGPTIYLRRIAATSLRHLLCIKDE
jgi:hypothetical protein